MDELVVRPNQLFDSTVHYGGPARETESTFHFLNRAEGVHWTWVRRTLQSWYEQYPDGDGDLRSRFRQDTPQQHVAAWWELYVFTLFRRLGYAVDVHPQGGAGKRPDFLISRASERVFVECMVLFDDAEFPRSDSQAWIFDCINDVSSDDFMVDLTIDTAGTNRPSAREIQLPIELWLNSLNWEKVSQDVDRGFDAPHRSFRWRDWQITLTAWPIGDESRGEPGRLIGSYLIGDAEPREDEERVKALLAKKGSRYGPAQPLILAMLTWSSFIDERDVTNALFGSVAVKYFENSAVQPWMVRLRNGYWRPGGVRRGARVAGVLFGEHLMKPWSSASALPLYFINPWADTVVALSEPFGTRTASDAGVIASTAPTRTPADVFGFNGDTFTQDVGSYDT